MIRRLLATARRKTVQRDPKLQRKADQLGDALRQAAAAGAIRPPSLPTDVLPSRTPGEALNAAVTPYALDGLPLYPADELLIGQAPTATPAHLDPALPAGLLPTTRADIAYDPATGAAVRIPATASTHLTAEEIR